MRLIDADDLKEAVCPYGLKDTDLILEMIDDAPTIDAVPVVRCKDCVHYLQEDSICIYTAWTLSPNDFCSCGERKNDAGEID